MWLKDQHHSEDPGPKCRALGATPVLASFSHLGYFPIQDKVLFMCADGPRAGLPLSWLKGKCTLLFPPCSVL